jgi:pyruvate/2-oxoglutarate dehydrogenase complex dihydrolipoamide dehydrogenase (E3) component
MTDIGVTLCHEEEVVAIREESDGLVTVSLTHRPPITTTTLLYAIGRIGATKHLNLEAVGLTPDARGRVIVNEHFQTAIPHIYAAGDVIGFPALASPPCSKDAMLPAMPLAIPTTQTQTSCPTASIPFLKSPRWDGMRKN